MNPREAARLMGLADSYVLPARTTDAFHLVGDGVATPVVRFLSERLLLPLIGDDPERDLAPRAKTA
jgi:DNA (cytosine-5)-methyltransferase 1